MVGTRLVTVARLPAQPLARCQAQRSATYCPLVDVVRGACDGLPSWAGRRECSAANRVQRRWGWRDALRKGVADGEAATHTTGILRSIIRHGKGCEQGEEVLHDHVAHFHAPGVAAVGRYRRGRFTCTKPPVCTLTTVGPYNTTDICNLADTQLYIARQPLALFQLHVLLQSRPLHFVVLFETVP